MADATVRCHVCSAPAGDTAAQISYGPIPIMTLCANCAAAAIDLIKAGGSLIGPLLKRLEEVHEHRHDVVDQEAIR